MLKKTLKRFIPSGIKEKLRSDLGVPNQEDSLKRIKALGFNPALILDIGAYEGNWCKFIKSIYPKSSVFMIEGQLGKENILDKTSNSLSDVSFAIELLGADVKEVEFNIYDTASSVLKEQQETCARTEKRQLNTLDNILSGTRFACPDLIKIDTQGYELEILKGGTKALSCAQAVLLEVSMIDIYSQCPLVADILTFMKAQGFVLYDICSIMRRPLDNALFQSDFLFLKENSELRKNKSWS